MQRAIAHTGKVAGALSVLLALPASFNAQAAGYVSDPAALSRLAESSSDQDSGTSLNRWRNYALASITPHFSWAQVTPAANVIPQVTDALTTSRPSALSSSLHMFQSGAAVSLSVARGAISEVPGRASPVEQRLLDAPQYSGIERTVVAPTISFPWGERGTISTTAVLAYQRFASIGLGIADAGLAPSPTTFAARDTSYGAGVRVDGNYRLTDRLAWSAGYQTRVGMDAFRNYRGVYGDPGNFDIPAQANFLVSYALTPWMSVDVGVDRVMYSEIKPFTSSGFPIRFLALLGDGLSPNFAWQDLNVYSAGWTLHNRTIGEFQLRYTTQQQPEPTSALLRSALEPDIARYAVSMAWSRATGNHSRFSFLTNYTPAPYLLGLPASGNRDSGSLDRFEFQALWAVAF